MRERSDLLALTDDSLAALANRGIVKRATRDVAEGRGPTLTVDDDGTVTAEGGDGIRVVAPPGATLEEARCTCPASGVCRHRVMLVMAYRALAGDAGSGAGADAGTGWSPAQVTDEQLEAAYGARVVGRARRTLRSGYRARVRRPTVGDPVWTVELDACTVRFLVPDDLGYAHVDAARGSRDDAVALAVWAARTAVTVAGGDEPAVLDVAVEVDRSADVTTGSGLEGAVALAAELLDAGVAGLGPAVATPLARVRQELDRADLRWAVDVVEDLADQVATYEARHARYQPARAAALVAELVARHRCVVGGGASLRPTVLGTEEAAQTPLRLLRLTGLGARVRGDDDSTTVEVHLAHPEAGVVLTVRRRVDAEPDAEPPDAATIGRRTVGGGRLSALAGGAVVTESAVRYANRLVTISTGRVGKTTAAPSSGRWEHLPSSLLVGDLDEERARLAARPPAVVRARVAADAVRAIVVEEVEAVGYAPGAQRLSAVVRAPVGRAHVVLDHSAHAPAALDALAAALTGGDVAYLAGHVTRHRGEVVVEPTAVAAGGRVVVPVFAAADGAVVLGPPPPPPTGIEGAIAVALDVMSEVVHHGWRHRPRSWADRTGEAADRLAVVGLATTAAALRAVVALPPEATPEHRLDLWADAHLRLLVADEAL